MVEIRTAHIEDFKFLSKIFSLNVPKYFDDKELDDFKKYFIKNVKTYSIIKLNNKIIGGAGYVMENESTGRITWSFIHPNFHRQGFGKKIVVHCMNSLKDFKSLEIWQKIAHQWVIGLPGLEPMKTLSVANLANLESALRIINTSGIVLILEWKYYRMVK